jgi:flagellar export protein FliJ
MPFRFRLQTVLQLRDSLEKHEASVLQRIQAEIAQTGRQIQQAEAAIMSARRSWEQALRIPTVAVELASMLGDEKSLTSAKDALEEKLAKLAAERDQQMSRYQQAHRDHEVVLNLRRERLAEYEQQQARAQQKMLDDIVMSRRLRS